MKRVVSGIKPTGDPTLGNYLGAMVRWPGFQHDKEAFYFIANLHAITVRQDAKELEKRTYDIYAWLMTVGVDPEKAVIFVQSMVPAHSEIAWVLNNYVTMGELGKMTQFKDKSAKSNREGQLVGLFDYPVLMAGDVLLYDADEIPVGDDQTQHVELARNIAQRFNNTHGFTFKEPKATVSETTARIMSLNNPEVKMSKTDDSPESYVLIEDKPEVILKKFKRAVTDSDNSIRFDPVNKPAVSNLLNIYSGFTGKSIPELETEFEGAGYGKLKTGLGELVAEKFKALQEEFLKFRGDMGELNRIMKDGNERASAIANDKMTVVKQKLGLL